MTARGPLGAASTRPVRLAPADLLGLGLIGIRTRKARAALSALGISIGIATMIVVTGIPASSQAHLEAELAALGTNVLQAGPARSAGNPVRLPETAPGMVSRIRPVIVASGVGDTQSVVRRNDRVDPRDGAGLTVLASQLNLPRALNARMRQGTFLTGVTQKFPTAVLGFVAATRLGVTGVTAGGEPQQIMIGDQWFTVVGILARTPLSPEVDQSVLVGWDTAKDLLGFDGHPTAIYVQSQEHAIESVRAVLPATIDPENPGNVAVTRPSDALAAKRATENTFSALFLGLAAVALLVGGVGVANTMVISVLERRSEIGLRRALGASRGQIRGQFLTESVALSGLGGIAGTILGLLATAGYAASQGWPIVVPVSSTVAGLGGALAVGMVAGAYPSIRAARLTPTEALAKA
jgi:putative ABC transport system permease protein